MRAQFYLDRLNTLVGAKIVGTVVDQDDEFFGLALTMPNGDDKSLWFSSDDEGNGPGSFSLEDA